MPARRRVKKSYKSYKRAKRYKGLKRLFKVFTLSLTGFFLLGVSYYIYVLAVNIQKPFAQASKGTDYSNTTYNSTQPINIVFVQLDSTDTTQSDILNLYLLNLSPKSSQSVLVKIPTDYTIENYKGMGSITLSKIYGLNFSEGTQDAVKALFSALESTLAIKIDGYVIYDNYTVQSLKDANINISADTLSSNLNYTDYLKIKQLFTISRRSVKSDLNTLELLRIISDIKDSGVNYKYQELVSQNLTYNFDDFWRQNTNYEMVKGERVTVTILNSTSTPGLASLGGRYVENLGGVITELGNSENLYEKNEMYSTLPEDNYTLNLLKSYFNISTVKSPDEFIENAFLANRSEILLVLGEQTLLELF